MFNNVKWFLFVFFRNIYTHLQNKRAANNVKLYRTWSFRSNNIHFWLLLRLWQTEIRPKILPKLANLLILKCSGVESIQFLFFHSVNDEQNLIWWQIRIFSYFKEGGILSRLHVFFSQLPSVIRVCDETSLQQNLDGIWLNRN